MKMYSFSDIMKGGYIPCTCSEEGKQHFFYNSLELIENDKTLADYKIDDKSIIDVIDCEPEHCKICCSNLISKIEKEKNELYKQLNKEKDKTKELLKENRFKRKIGYIIYRK